VEEKPHPLLCSSVKRKKGFLGKSLPGKPHTLPLKEAVPQGAMGWEMPAWQQGLRQHPWRRLFPGEPEAGTSPPRGFGG